MTMKDSQGTAIKLGDRVLLETGGRRYDGIVVFCTDFGRPMLKVSKLSLFHGPWQSMAGRAEMLVDLINRKRSLITRRMKGATVVGRDDQRLVAQWGLMPHRLCARDIGLKEVGA